MALADLVKGHAPSVRGELDYNVEIIENLGDFRTVLAEYQALTAEGAENRCFESDPLNVELAFENHPERSLRIVIVRSQGKIICVAPFFAHRSKYKLRFSVVTMASFPAMVLKLLGRDFVYALEADKRHCRDLVFQSLFQIATNADMILLEAIDAEGDLWNHCLRDLRNFRGVRDSSRLEKLHRIVLPPSHQEYVSSLHSNTRQTLRRRTKKLVDQKGAQLSIATSPEQVQAFFDQMDAVFPDTWQAKTFGHAPQNTPATIAKHERIASQGWFRSYSLLCDGRPIAFQLGYQYGDTFYARAFGYSQQWAEFSPGAVLMNLFIADLYQQRRPAIVDLGYGDMGHKRSFGGLAQDVGNLYLVRKLRWRWAVRLQRLLTGMENTIRAGLVRVRLDRYVRKLIKHQA